MSEEATILRDLVRKMDQNNQMLVRIWEEVRGIRKALEKETATEKLDRLRKLAGRGNNE